MLRIRRFLLLRGKCAPRHDRTQSVPALCGGGRDRFSYALRGNCRNGSGMHPMIGVMDSGIGGLTAVSVLHRRFPKEDILYFADTLHLPYGEKDPTTLRQLTRRAIALYSRTRRVRSLPPAERSALLFFPICKHRSPFLSSLHPRCRRWRTVFPM